MNSEEISIIATEPFVLEFISTIIQNIRAKNFVYEERQVIHADLVPKVSTKVMHASLGEKTTIPTIKKELKTISPKIKAAPIISHPQITPPMAPKGAQTQLSQEYGKITLLLNDPSISTIECQGAGKPIMVIRIGQKQITRIVLSAKDIKIILDKVSDAAHIPLLEGVFRAAVDNFSINAIISEIIGSKFVIKKQVNYARGAGNRR